MFARFGTALVAAAVALPLNAQEPQLLGREDSVFTTSLTVPSGGTFRLYNFNGPIETTLASGSQVQVRAEKRTRTDSRMRQVGFTVVKDGNTTTLCAVHVGHTRCRADGMDHDHDDWDDDDDDGRPPRVVFTVAVPKGVRVVLMTGNGEMRLVGTGAGVRARSGNGEITVAAAGDAVDVSSGNGDIEVSGAGGPVEVRTGNGSIQVRTTVGPVNAGTGNGPIDVQMDRLTKAENMEFRTGNGRITVTLPANYEGEIDSSTGNGGIESDFPITIEGRTSPRHLRGVIGKGGPRLRLSSGNGSIRLRKAR